MTALAEGELAQRFPHGKRVHSAENSFHLKMECKSIKNCRPSPKWILSTAETSRRLVFLSGISYPVTEYS